MLRPLPLPRAADGSPTCFFNNYGGQESRTDRDSCVFAWRRDSTLAVVSLVGLRRDTSKFTPEGPLWACGFFGEDSFVEADVTEVFLVFSRV